MENTPIARPKGQHAAKSADSSTSIALEEVKSEKEDKEKEKALKKQLENIRKIDKNLAKAFEVFHENKARLEQEIDRTNTL